MSVIVHGTNFTNRNMTPMLLADARADSSTLPANLPSNRPGQGAKNLYFSLYAEPSARQDEAQAFVNANARAGFTTSRFTSPAGLAVERLGAT